MHPSRFIAIQFDGAGGPGGCLESADERWWILHDRARRTGQSGVTWFMAPIGIADRRRRARGNLSAWRY